MDAKRVETISARVDAAVSSPGRTVAACLGANLVICNGSVLLHWRQRQANSEHTNYNLILPCLSVKKYTHGEVEFKICVFVGPLLNSALIDITTNTSF